MFRFLTTLVLTVVGLLAASVWWSSSEGEHPAPSSASTPAATPRPEPEPETKPRITKPAVTEIAAVEPAPLPAPRAVPPIPAPRIADRPARELPERVVPAIPEPTRVEPESADFVERMGSFDLEAEETVLPAPVDFGSGFETEPVDEFGGELGGPNEDDLPVLEPEERAVAMRSDHDESADLIRRLLEVYENLGRRR